MSDAHASWSERLLPLALLWMSSCGGQVADDTSHPQSAGGTSTSASGGATSVYPTAPAGYPSFGGMSPTTGIHVSSLGSAGMGGGSSAPVGGARQLTGGARALGGSPASGGRLSVPGGTRATSVAGSFGGILASGGLSAIAGKPSTGGLQGIGGTHATTTFASGGSSAAGDVCILPPDAGSCDAYFQSYYFNPFHGRCEPFIYGGCGGNANRFDSLQACEQRCTQSGCPLTIPPTSPIWTCPLSAACYYQFTTGCRCLAENGECNIDATCTAEDAGADASSQPADAGESPRTPLPVVLCTCGSSAWACRVIELLAP